MSKRKIQVTVDEQGLEDSQAVFDQLGLSTSEAISLFLKQVSIQGDIPFSVSVFPTDDEINRRLDLALSNAIENGTVNVVTPQNDEEFMSLLDED
ncbi:MAG: type II toxin-antitoxin system RelB/DinJ family antitoxin [Lactobacillaceae bacterium]|nr:type II toxin-antitoxin system RelB/DinJ family antitoxin [Lactobacillaceae bacterium]